MVRIKFFDNILTSNILKVKNKTVKLKFMYSIKVHATLVFGFTNYKSLFRGKKTNMKQKSKAAKRRTQFCVYIKKKKIYTHDQ